MNEDTRYHINWYLVPRNSRETEYDDMSKYDTCFSEDFNDFSEVSGSYLISVSRDLLFSITLSEDELESMMGDHDILIQIQDSRYETLYNFYYTKEEIIKEWEKTM